MSFWKELFRPRTCEIDGHRWQTFQVTEVFRQGDDGKPMKLPYAHKYTQECTRCGEIRVKGPFK